MKHHSPLQQINYESNTRLHRNHSPPKNTQETPQKNFSNTPLQSMYQIRDGRAQSITPLTKVTKITVLHPIQNQNINSSSVLQTSNKILRPVERRTVQLYENHNVHNVEYHQTDVNVHIESLLIQKDQYIEQLKQDNGRLSQTNADLFSQLESYKIRYHNLEREFEQFSNRQSQVDSYKIVIQENRIQFEQEIVNLRFELNNSTKMFQQNEIDWQDKNNRYKIVIQEQENKIALLSSEIERINCILIQKTSQLLQFQKIQQQSLSLETQLKVRDDITEERNQEISRLRGKLIKVPELESLIQSLRDENQKLQINLDEYSEEIECRNRAIQEQENHIDALSVEIENLNSQLQQKSQQLFSMSQMNEEELNKYQTQNEHLQLQIENLTQETQRLNFNFNSKVQQLNLMKEEINFLKNNLNEQLEQVQYFKDDSAELNSIKLNLTEQMNYMKQESQQQKLTYENIIKDLRINIENSQSRFSESQEKICVLSSEVLNLNNKLKQRQNELDQRLQEQYEMKQTIKNLHYQITQLQENINSGSLALQRLDSDGQRMMDEKQHRINQLNITIQQLEQDLTIMSNKKNMLEMGLNEEQAASSQWRNRANEFENDLFAISSENSKVVGDLNFERKRNASLCEELKNSIQTSHEEREKSLQEIDSLESSCSNSHQRISIISLDLEKCRSQIKDYQDKVVLLSSENERLHSDLKNQQREYQSKLLSLSSEHEKHLRTITIEFQDKFMFVNSENERHQIQFKSEINQQQNKLVMITTENERLHCDINQIHREYNEVKNLITEYQNKFIVMNSENEGLVSQLKSLNREYQNIQNQIQTLQNKFVLIASECERLHEENNQITSQLHSTEKTHQIQMESYEDIKAQLSRNLRSKEVELDNLSFKNQGQYNEIQRLLIELKQVQNNGQESESMCESMDVEITQYREQVSHLNNELDSWKQKFITLNREFHKTQEDLMMISAEFDAFRQRKTTVTGFTKVQFNFVNLYQETHHSHFEVRKSVLSVSSVEQEKKSYLK